MAACGGDDDNPPGRVAPEHIPFFEVWPVSGTSARLIWQPSPDNVDGYVIFRSITNNTLPIHEIARIDNEGELISGDLGASGTVEITGDGRFSVLNANLTNPNRYYNYDVRPFNKDFRNGHAGAGAGDLVWVQNFPNSPIIGFGHLNLTDSATAWPVLGTIREQGQSFFFSLDASDADNGFNIEWQDRKNFATDEQTGRADVRVRVRKQDYSMVSRDYSVSPAEVGAYGELGPFEAGTYIVEIRSSSFGTNHIGTCRIRARQLSE